MSLRWLIPIFLALVLAVAAHAQTVEPHIRFGMKPDRSTPPEVIDMKWARQYMDDNATHDANATSKDE